jgi:hypothetical protein
VAAAENAMRRQLCHFVKALFIKVPRKWRRFRQIRQFHNLFSWHCATRLAAGRQASSQFIMEKQVGGGETTL